MVGAGLSGAIVSDFTSRPPTAQSLPATPSAANVRTFTDYSGEHTRLTTLHGSTGALEVNNLGGFKLGGSASLSSNGTASLSNSSTSSSAKFASVLESSIDGIVRTNSSVSVSNAGMVMGGGVGGGGEFSGGSMRTGRSNSDHHIGLSAAGTGLGVGGMVGKLGGSGVGVGGVSTAGGLGLGGMGAGMVGGGMGGAGGGVGLSNGGGVGGSNGHVIPHHYHHHTSLLQGLQSTGAGGGSVDDDMADVFTGLSFKDPPSLGAAPGYGRSRPRRASAPVGMNGEHGAFGALVPPQNGYGLWGNGNAENPLPDVSKPPSSNGHDFSVAATSRNSPIQPFSSTNTHSGSFSAGIDVHPAFNTAWTSGVGMANGGGGVGMPIATTKNIWSQGSRPSSQTSSYGSTDGSIQSSPVYSPTSSTGFGGFGTSSGGGGGPGGAETVPNSLGIGLLTTTPLSMGLGEERSESRSPFRVCIIKCYV